MFYQIQLFWFQRKLYHGLTLKCFDGSKESFTIEQLPNCYGSKEKNTIKPKPNVVMVQKNEILPRALF